MMLRLLRRLFSAEALGLILVVSALQTLTFGVSSSLRGTDTKYLFWISLLAALLGLLLNIRKWKGIQAAAWIVVVGILGVWILGARLTYPLLDLIQNIFALIPQIVPAVREQIPIDTSMITESWHVIAQASFALFVRWQTWLMGLDRNVRVNDALVRNMIWTLLLWLIAASTGWFTGRRNAMLALLPHVALLAIVISYSEYKIETLWLTVFIMLILMGVWNYKNHTIQWQHHKVDYSDSIRYDNTQAVLLLAISIGAIAFITPSISWRDIRDYLRERNESKAAEMLGIQEQKVTTQNTYVQKPSLPREHLLTEGFAQSQQLVMTIRTGELPPIPASSLTMTVPRYYWRSTIYDRYTGEGWMTGSASSQSYSANTPLVPGLLDGYRPLHLDVQLQQPEGKLFWSGILYSADVPFRADWRVKPQSNLFADQAALLQADMFAVATGARAYSAEAYVPDITIADLRNASTDYPEKIRERYLLLPKALPDRVRQLAEQIVKGKSDPYDKAKAIESYLRITYPYDLEVPAPPEDQDVADYFLFDLKKGYCDYYATAMVVLARASGLPARFVSGYSSGSYDAPNAQYVVRELNAHSWAEIYFPGIGWIEFEPTGSQPEIERPEKAEDVVTPSDPVTPASRILFQFTHGKLLLWISPLLIVMLLIVLYDTLFERVIFTYIAPATAVQILYRRYYRLGRSLAGTRTRAETANEFTDKVIRRIKEMNRHAAAKKMNDVKMIASDADRFTQIYSSTLFSDHATGKKESMNALTIWKRLRRSLIWERFKYFIGGKKNRDVSSSY